MISFNIDGIKFNYRVATIIIDNKNNRILLSRNFTDKHWFLPGGKCEISEFSKDAAVREISEELKSQVIIDRPVFLVENIFLFRGSKMHEIGVYYLAHFDDNNEILNKKEDLYHKEKSGHEFVYRWHSLSELDSIEFQPAIIKNRLGNLPNCMEIVEICE